VARAQGLNPPPGRRSRATQHRFHSVRARALTRTRFGQDGPGERYARGTRRLVLFHDNWHPRDLQPGDARLFSNFPHLDDFNSFWRNVVNQSSAGGRYRSLMLAARICWACAEQQATKGGGKSVELASPDGGEVCETGVWAGGSHVAARPVPLPLTLQGPVMHAACSRNGDGSRHTPKTSPTPNRLGAAFAEPAASPENGGGRDAKGRFAPGNAGGPGNPFARRTAELRREFLAEASGEDLRAVCRALLERAKGGDVAAAKLALSYLVGKPEKAVDPDTLDEQEWHIWRRFTAPSEWVELIQTLPLDIVLRLVRDVWPVLAREKVAQAEPLFTAPAPAPQEPERGVEGGKTRTRRRGGTRRRPEAEEGSPGTEGPRVELPAEAPRAEELGPLTCPAAAGGAAGDGRHPDGAQQASASEVAAVERQAGRLPYGAERPGPAPEGQAGTRTRAAGPGEPSRRQGEGKVPPVSPGGEPGEGGDNGGGDGKRCPSANGGDGAAPAAGAAVNKGLIRKRRSFQTSIKQEPGAATD
jgi:hypothetical protein